MAYVNIWTFCNVCLHFKLISYSWIELYQSTQHVLQQGHNRENLSGTWHRTIHTRPFAWAQLFVFVPLLSQSLFSSVILNVTRLETFSPFQHIALWGQSTSLWQHITIIQRNAHYRDIYCPLQKYGYQHGCESKSPAPRILVLHPLLLCTKCCDVSHA